jgi:hypothetical protein
MFTTQFSKSWRAQLDQKTNMTPYEADFKFYEYGLVSLEAHVCCPDRKTPSCRPCGFSFNLTASDQTTNIVQG